MEREILFRGKKELTDEWIYGSLIQSVFGIKSDRVYIGNFLSAESVCHATVGQYTGLTDKHGVKIFEGDIVEYDSKNYKMMYIDGFAAFALRSVDNMRLAPRITTNTVPRMNVVGNIYDNPELLEM